MKINLARQKLLQKRVICGPSLCYPAPEIAEEAAQHGFDFVWLDWQHGAWTESTINSALASFVHVETAAVVRTPSDDATWISRVLDLGALGVIVPMVETVVQCESIVAASKFPPQGRRSATGLRTPYHAIGQRYDYLRSAMDYTENANDQILVVVMLETEAGIRNVREIMRVAGIDCVLIGPYDLSRSIGASSMDDPRVEDLIQEVLAASSTTGVAAGYVTNTPEEAQHRVQQGFRMVCPGHDVTVLPKAFHAMKRCSDRLDSIRTAAHPRAVLA
jgi:2-keto-3-deoxy-L-rhamnonate aldolase RhmA